MATHSNSWQCMMAPHMSRQSASSKQSVLTQPRSGFGEVRPESVVHKGKHGSGENSPLVASFAASVDSSRGVARVKEERRSKVKIENILFCNKEFSCRSESSNK